MHNKFWLFRPLNLNLCKFIIRRIRMKKIGFLFLMAGVAVLSSCDYQKNNRIKQKDVREGDERVYGDGPGTPARQRAQQYEASPEDAARASAIQEKLYGN
jgi:hypothetical protein